MPEEPRLHISPSLAIILAGVLVAGAILFVNFYAPRGVMPVDVAGAVVAAAVTPPASTDHWRGNKSAPIVLVEYSDFQCPYCALIHPTLKRIVEESNGDVAWVYRHLPLESIHPEARSAAVAAECIAEQLGDEGFWAFADRMFENSGALQRGMNSALYLQLATSLGANPLTFNACTTSERFETLIDTHTTEAIENGGNGTPFTIVVAGGEQFPFSGALPYAQIQAVIKSVQGRQ
jgi:protein-disulfide isomerase